MFTPPEVLSALTTPFRSDQSVDLEAFRSNLERLEPLVDGVFVGGTTGEFPALSVEECSAILEAALSVFEPDRVVAHVGSPSTHQSLQLTKSARALGVVRFAALTPYYLPASVEGITRHWAAIKEACGGDLYGYIYPDVAVTDLLPEDLPSALSSGIDGIKISATASARVAEYLRHAPDGFKLWSGNDADLPNVLQLGGTGTVSGVSGVCPEPWAQLREAHHANDQDSFAAAQAKIDQIVPLLGPSIANLKFGLDLQGLAGGECRMSIDAPSAETRVQIESALRSIGAIGGEDG